MTIERPDAGCEVLARNLAALAIAAEAVAGEDSCSRVDRGADGPQLFASDGGSAWLRVHSARDAAGEARRWLDRELDGHPVPSVVLLCGCGLGYVVDAIQERAPETTIIVVEPSPQFARLFLERFDWSRAIAARRLCVLVGPRYDASPVAAAILAGCKAEPRALLHPVLSRAWPERLARARQLVERRRFGLVANAQARERFAVPYLLNTLSNLQALASEGDVSALEGAFTGKPAFVVAAGPSLDRNVEVLRRVRDQGLLICVDTALPPLSHAGLIPDLVVAVDPSPLNARHLSAGPVDERTYLVAEGSLDPLALTRFRGRTFFYRVADHDPWPWLRAKGVEKGRLRAWGSVLITALDLAYRLGADPVVLFGADLALTGGRTHARGVAHEEVWALQGSNRALVSAQALASPSVLTAASADGSPVPTLRHLLEFRDAVLEGIPAGREVVNATGGGVLHGPGLRALTSIDGLLNAGRFDATPILAERRRQAAGRHDWAVPSVDPATRASWLSDLPGLSSAMLDGVTARASAATSEGAVLQLEPAITAAVHAALARRDPPDWAREALRAQGLPGGSIEACLRRASAALIELLGRGHVGASLRPAAPSLLRQHGGAAPVSALFELSAAAANRVAELESCVAHLASRLDVPGNPFVWPMWPFRLTLGPDAPARASELPWGRPPAWAALATSDDCEALARWLLVLTYARAEALVAANSSPEDGSASLADLLSVIHQSIAGSPARPAASVSLSLAGDRLSKRSGPIAQAGVDAWMLARAVTGNLVFVNETDDRAAAARCAKPEGLSMEWPAEAGDPRSLFFGGRRWRVRARDLHEAGLPSCSHVVALDDRRVLATPYGSRRGWLIDESGEMVEESLAWPVCVSGVLPRGDRRIAWGYDDRGGLLAWWSDGGCQRQLHVGARLGRVATDGRGWLTCTRTAGETICVRETDGEIRGVDGAVRGVVSMSAGRALSVAAIALGPDGKIDRRRDGVSFRLDGADWCPVPNGSLGPCWSQEERGGCVASAYPHSDLVTVEAEGMRSARLAVYYPTCLAWAGRSLVVTNADGEVLLFQGLADEVRRLAALDIEHAIRQGEVGSHA